MFSVLTCKLRHFEGGENELNDIEIIEVVRA